MVTERGEEAEAYALHTARSDQLGLWLQSRWIDRKTCDVLEECARVNQKAAALVRQVQERDKELAELVKNQERLRKHLQALGTSQDESGLRERYVGELSRAEDRIAEGRAEVKRMRTEKDALEE